MLVATPHYPYDERIVYFGEGITADDAIQNLSRFDVLEWFDSEEMSHKDTVTLRIFNQVAPEQAGWESDDAEEMGFDWCIGELIETREVSVFQLKKLT